MTIKERITTALDRFSARNAGKTFMPIPFAIGVAASVVIPSAVGFAVLPTQVDAVRQVATEETLDIPALEAAIGDKKAILDEIEKNEARRAALVAASAAMQRMIDAKSPTSHRYEDGADTEERRKSDFEAARSEYEAAISAAGLDDPEPAADVAVGGPNTSFKIDETEFALDAIEALGGDVESARRQAGLKP